MKKFTCLLIAVCMAFTALPLNIFAYDGYTLEDELLTGNATAELDQETFYSYTQEFANGQIQVSATYSPILTYASNYVSEEEAAASVREYMKNRVSNFTIKFKSSVGPQEILTQIVNLAAAHTGVPNEGDYIMWQFSKIGASFSYGKSGSTYYYEIPLQVSYFTTKAQENVVDGAVQSILQELNVSQASDLDKITAVYDYICDNVTYDFENLEDETYLLKHSAYSAFIDKTAVCQGYALMFYRLMLELGVDCRIITGTSFDTPHAWNIVKLDGRYYNLDSTWDAGYDEYLYFLKTPGSFADHDRDAEYTTDEFNQKYPMAEDSLFEIIDGELVAYYGEGISDIVIPDGVTKIGYHVFENNYDIVNVTIPEGVTLIDENAFWNCKNLESVTLPSTLETIKGGAFSYCEKLKDVSIPASVTIIGNSAFASCDSLTSIVLPEGLTNLGSGAFAGCTNLKTINIPESITEISDRTFSSCYSIEEIILHEKITSVGSNAFFNFNGVIKFMNPETEIYDSATTIGDGATVYGYNVSTAGDYARKWSKNFIPFDPETELPIIASGTCGENLTWEIDPDYNLIIKGTGEMTSAPWKTDYNKSINNVILEEGVTSIFERAFDYSKIVSITLPSTLEYIGEYAFYYCDTIESISLPDGLKAIDEKALSACHKLTEVVIPDSVTTLGDGVFENSYNITSIALSNNLETIPDSAFSGCSKLADIVIPNSVKTIGESAFKSTSLVNAVIPDSVTEIGQYSFANIYSLESLTISNSLTSIPDFAFNYCPELKIITIPESVTSIGRSAFYRCTALTEVVIPKSVTSIGMDAFDYCNNIEKIYVYSSKTAINSSSDTFPEGATIYGYDNSTAQSYAKTHQREFVSLGSAPVASGKCGDNVTWLLTEDGTLTISGEGEMTDYAYLDTSLGQIVRSPWNEYAEFITSVHVETGVTSIGDDSFYNCINLTEVILPEGLTDIGKFAFDGCKSLESIKIPLGVTIIDDGAFNECDKLTDVIIPDSVTDIGIGAFMDCDSLTSITIPDSVESIERNAFDRNPNLISITFESATTEIYDSLYTISDSATIYGHADSTAQAYAEKYGREFVDLSTLYTAGDLDGDDIIDNNDAIYLLYYTIFGEEGGYTVDQPCDFDGSGEVDNNDAIYLLYHTIFGAEEYPLNLQ